MAITIDAITIQMPTEHGWTPGDSIGISAAGGNEVISAIWGYDLEWSSLQPAEFNVLFGLWFDNQNAHVTAHLPELGAATYAEKDYTCRVDPLTFKTFFEGTYNNVRMKLVGIDITA